MQKLTEKAKPMVDVEERCLNCGSSALKWDYVIKGPAEVSQGRHHTGEMSVCMFLGCTACSDTVRVESLDVFLDRLRHGRSNG
jgi:hypothetical protein